MKNQTETNATEETLNATNSTIVSNESSSGPLIQSSVEGSKDKSNQSEEAGEKTSLKTPGFEIRTAILGVGLSQAFLKRKN